MPIYEFICDECFQPFDVQASIQEKEEGLEPTCPNCSNTNTHQIISGGLFLRAAGGTSFMPPDCGPSAGSGCCG